MTALIMSISFLLGMQQTEPTAPLYINTPSGFEFQDGCGDSSVSFAILKKSGRSFLYQTTSRQVNWYPLDTQDGTQWSLPLQWRGSWVIYSLKPTSKLRRSEDGKYSFEYTSSAYTVETSSGKLVAKSGAPDAFALSDGIDPGKNDRAYHLMYGRLVEYNALQELQDRKSYNYNLCFPLMPVALSNDGAYGAVLQGGLRLFSPQNRTWAPLSFEGQSTWKIPNWNQPINAVFFRSNSLAVTFFDRSPKAYSVSYCAVVFDLKGQKIASIKPGKCVLRPALVMN